MTQAGHFIRLSTRRSARRFDVATADPVAVQQAKLMAILRANAGTEYGRRYGFDRIRSIADYQRAVPVVDYAAIQGDIERMTRGEKNILTAEDPVMFAQTSGTSGDPKFIPVTPTCQGREHSDVMRTWLWHARSAHPTIFDGRIVTLVSPAVEGHTPAGIPYGSTSGHMYQNIPWIVRRIYSIPYPAFLIEDYQAKYYALMRTALEQNVTFLCTANPSSILKLCEKADAFADDIIRDIHDGTLSRNFEIEPEIRTELERIYRPNPERARRLEQMRARRDGRLKPCDYWPNLALIGCWKGGTVGHYLTQFDGWFAGEGRPVPPVRDWGYLASEMRGSVPLSDEGSAGVLTVATNFYEFVPVEQVEAAPNEPQAWTFLTVGDVEDGRDYHIFVTTTGGLYRYDINDIVRIDGCYQKTPRVVFQRKGRGMISLTGEKLSVNQFIEAVAAAREATGVSVPHFKAEADPANNRYVIRAEFDRAPTDSEQRAFLRTVEEHLQAINLEYRAKRESQRLAAPVLHVMREGWYERNRRELVQRGRRMFQAKTEILSPIKAETREIRHELLQIVELDEAP